MLSKTSIKKLRALQAAILAEPEFYHQGHYPVHGDTCQSPCCFSGWAVWLNNPDARAYRSAIRKGNGVLGPMELAEAVGITFEQASILFANWNGPASYMWGSIEGAKDGAARIDKFIASGGRD